MATSAGAIFLGRHVWHYCRPAYRISRRATSGPLVPWFNCIARPFTQEVATLSSSLPPHTLDIPDLCLATFDTTTSAIEARLVCPSASSIELTRLPARLHADRPLDIELASVGLATQADTVARWITAHTRLSVAIRHSTSSIQDVPITTRRSGGGWIVRALVRPSAWADADNVTVVSLSLAGQPLPCDCLPATLQVGYNHAPAPAGAVLAAAKDGDVPALRVALDAGGSTEEADEVRSDIKTGGRPLHENPSPPAAAWLSFLLLGRHWRPPRGPSHALGSRRLPSRSKQCR